MLIDLAELGLITVSGAQSAEFLQGQVSCDLTEINAFQSRLGVHCNSKGRVLATFRIFYVDQNYYLLLPKSMVAFLINDLKKYAIFYKVQLQSTNAFPYKIGISNDSMIPTLNDYGFSNTIKNNEVSQNRDGIILLNIPGIHARAILFSPKILTSDIQAFYYWQQLDINNGLASIYPSTRAMFTPHQLDYHKHQGISFSKGCYTGQEVIARMHYLGQLKTKLYRVSGNSMQLPQEGTAILDKDDQKQGTVVMVAAIKNDAYQALASIYDFALNKALFLNQMPLHIVQAV